MKVCLYQFLNCPNLYLRGVGDCSKCVPDEKNQYCTLYHPIVLLIEEVIDEQKPPPPQAEK